MDFEEIGKKLDSAYTSALNEIGYSNIKKLESRNLVLISKDVLLKLIVNQDCYSNHNIYKQKYK